MVSVDGDEGDAAASALVSLRKAAKELNELADACELGYRDEQNAKGKHSRHRCRISWYERFRACFVLKFALRTG